MVHGYQMVAYRWMPFRSQEGPEHLYCLAATIAHISIGRDSTNVELEWAVQTVWSQKNSLVRGTGSRARTWRPGSRQHAARVYRRAFEFVPAQDLDPAAWHSMLPTCQAQPPGLHRTGARFCGCPYQTQRAMLPTGGGHMQAADRMSAASCATARCERWFQ